MKLFLRTEATFRRRRRPGPAALCHLGRANPGALGRGRAAAAKAPPGVRGSTGLRAVCPCRSPLRRSSIWVAMSSALGCARVGLW
jgi:hypothetical protein